MLLILGLLASSKLEPQAGDFIFQSIPCGATCEAIEEVTKSQFSTRGASFSHLGVVVSKAGKTWVIESLPPKGVQFTPLERFLERSDRPHYLGRPRSRLRSQTTDFIARLEEEIGKTYDATFLWGDDQFYCSELIYQALNDSGFDMDDGLKILRPMYFGLPTDKNYATWVNYYAKTGLPLPENELGVSPLGIFLWGKAELFEDLLVLE